MADNLPAWMWDVLADICAYEDIHGKDWPCLDKTWARVPEDVRRGAAVIHRYRSYDPDLFLSGAEAAARRTAGEVSDVPA